MKTFSLLRLLPLWRLQLVSTSVYCFLPFLVILSPWDLYTETAVKASKPAFELKCLRNQEGDTEGRAIWGCEELAVNKGKNWSRVWGHGPSLAPETGEQLGTWTFLRDLLMKVILILYPGIVAVAYNPRIWEVGAEVSWVQHHSGLHKFLSKVKQLHCWPKPWYS